MKTSSYIPLLIISTFMYMVAPVFYLPATAYAATMTSGTYRIEADSMNFGGARSSSGSYAIEDTGGEVGTGDLTGSSNKLHAGYQQATASSTSSSTPAVSSTQTSNQSSSGSRLPVNAINFLATPGQTSILLNWEYPADSGIATVRVVRSTTFFPTNITDGDVIFEGDARSIIDHNVTPGVTYYYTLFARNYLGFYASGVITQARVAVIGETGVPPISPENPFENVPDAQNVHPAISALTLADFDFIQDGKKIAHAGDTVVIDGHKNLTVQLAYNKVPQLLKTIAFSLSDPEDPTKVFTFLLRADADETVYEATIAPLNRSGQYRLRAIVLDYQNQGLKRLDGVLRAAVFEGSSRLFSDGKVSMSLIWVLVLIILIFIIVFVVRSVKRKKAATRTMPSDIRLR